MKAAICTKYGPAEVLQIRDVEIPVPRKNEMLVKIMATAVTASDIYIRSSAIPLRMRIPMRLMLGITKPRRKIIGLVFSGVVQQKGSAVTRFSEGDEVCGMTGFNLGCYAEFACVKESDSKTGCVAAKPGSITFEEATASVYGGSLALQHMNKDEIRSGGKLLVYGASGTSGTIAVQYGKYLGAEVTAVCSGRHADFVKSLGADRVIDYTKTDKLGEGERFDFMLDAAGTMKSSPLKEDCRRSLSENGVYASIDDGALLLSSKRLDYLSGLIDGGSIKPVIDRIYPFDELVEAHRYVEQGHKRGGVAVSVGS